MEKLEAVLRVLLQHGLNASMVGQTRLVWTEEINLPECSIYRDHIDIQDGKIAWFQSREDGSKELFRIFEDSIFFDFKPTTSHPDYGCEVHLVEWVGAYLVVVYRDKHNTVISSIKNGIVNSVEFHGDELIRRKDLLYFRTYGVNTPVSIVKIPELTVVESISYEEAVSRQAKPETLGYPNLLAP